MCTHVHTVSGRLFEHLLKQAVSKTGIRRDRNRAARKSFFDLDPSEVRECEYMNYSLNVFLLLLNNISWVHEVDRMRKRGGSQSQF